MARIVLNTFGSLGDLHPFLAIALELRARGHDATVATSEVYRRKIEAECIGFAPVRPDLGAVATDNELIAKVWDPRRGTEYLLRQIVFPSIADSYEDLDRAAIGADLLLTHSAGYAGPIVAEKRKLKWLSVVLQPTVLFSAFDPPVLAPAPWLKHTYRFGSWPFKVARRFGKLRVRSWIEPALKLRKRLGLTTSSNPIFEGQFSPYGTLALFSRHFAAPKPDWPHNSHVTGFVFYDRLGQGISPVHSAEVVASSLKEFLSCGPAPVVFTLGSSAVMHPGTFYRESLQAIRSLGMRAVMLVGPKLTSKLIQYADQSIFFADYAPYSELMPHAVAIVHQGGIGTTAQALRAGRPMLVVPWAHDQPDNAERLRKLGVARVLGRSKYTASSATRELSKLLKETSYSVKAAKVAAAIASENCSRAACDVIEAALG